MKIKTFHLGSIVLAILSFLIYIPILFNGFVADDEGLILHNKVLQNIANWPQFFLGGNFYSGGAVRLGGVYYKPAFSIILSFIYSLFGPNPAIFHFFSIVFHSVNVILIYLLLKNFWLAALFLAHPVNVESVAYISGMQEPIFLMFGLLGLLAKNKILCWLFLLLSLLTKETGVLFLPIYFLMKKNYWGPILVICLYAFLRFGVGQVYFNHEAVSPMMRADIITRLINIPSVLFFYIKQIVFPLDLLFSQNWIVTQIDFWHSIFVVLFFVLIFKYRSSNLYLVWFFLGIGLHLQLFPLDSTVSDRWLYFSLIGFVALLKNVNKKILIIITIIFAIRTFTRTFDWKDSFTLLSGDSVKNNDSFALESALGNEYLRRNEPDKALSHLQKSVNLFPSYLNLTNLGVVYSKKGDNKKALENYYEALRFGNFYLAYENIAGTYLLLNEDEKVKIFCEENLKKFPSSYKLRIYLAVALYRLGEKESALEQAKISYNINPLPETKYLLESIIGQKDVILQK